MTTPNRGLEVAEAALGSNELIIRKRNDLAGNSGQYCEQVNKVMKEMQPSSRAGNLLKERYESLGNKLCRALLSTCLEI